LIHNAGKTYVSIGAKRINPASDDVRSVVVLTDSSLAKPKGSGEFATADAADRL